MKLMQRLTEVLVEQVLAHAGAADLPEAVDREARRTLLNVLGTAIGASRQPAVQHLLDHAAEHGGATLAPVPGRPECTDVLHAAMAIGTAAHLDDFDDTHLETVIHPGAATLGAVLPIGTEVDASGAALLRAFALGCEAQLRVGSAMSPSHYDAGWHITGTCGVIGAAVAAGLLLELDRDALLHAVAIASSQTLGVRDAFGTMTKSYHPGKAAANGIVAAELASEGFTGADGALEHHQGFFAVLADDLDPARVTDGWGTHWELLSNTYKPYPCGIVIHPVIDGAVELHSGLSGRVRDIDEVVVHCHPLVVELTGNPTPSDGLEARFSAIHGVAVGLADGDVGLPQYADERVTADDLVALRARVRLEPDAAMARDASRVEVRIGDEVATAGVSHARGSLARPLSDHDLQHKVERLVEPILPGATAPLIAAIERLSPTEGLGDLTAAVTPVPATTEVSL
jgi:2-methylcitrate dehydratase PrpD